VSATATDNRRRRLSAIGLRATALAALSLLLLSCQEQPLPQQDRVRRDDCLREVTLDRLDDQIAICDEVVAAYPDDPGPRNERYLLHSLAGNDDDACADLREALRLAEQLPEDELDAQLRSDLEVRRELCANGPLTSPPTPLAPSP
jgi:hypothetical protein